MDSSNREGFALEERVRNIASLLPTNSFLRTYVTYAEQLTDCNTVYHLGGALALLTQTAPDDLHIRLGSRLFGNLYILIVGPSTNSRKTAAVKIAREVLHEALPGRAAEAPGSHEGLVESLRAQPRQLIPYEEFGHFLSSAEHGYLAPIKTALTSIYDGSPAGRQLVGTKQRPLPPVEKPRLSLFGACAPGFLSQHTKPVDWTDGFFGRFLTLQAPRAREYDLTPGDNIELRNWLVMRLRQLAAANGQPGSALGDGLSDAAKYLWKRWSHENIELSRRRSISRTAAAIGRAQALVLKIAMLIAWEQGHISEQPWQLQEHHIRPAIEIVKIHIDSVLSIGENLGGTVAMNDRQAVLQAFKDHPMTVGELCKSSFLLRRRVMEIIESLIEEKMIYSTTITNGASSESAYIRVVADDVHRPDAKVIQLFTAQTPSPSPFDSPATTVSPFGGSFPGDES